jgi:hypothetical protein
MGRIMEDPQRLFSMKLHETLIVSADGFVTNISAIRVPAGWIYTHTYYNQENDMISTTFVPWTNESRASMSLDDFERLTFGVTDRRNKQ